MIHGIPIVKPCPACKNGILIKNAGENPCTFQGCDGIQSYYISENELNSELVPALLKELDGYKKALINLRESTQFKVPKLSQNAGGWRLVKA
jgi:hypothetical protein